MDRVPLLARPAVLVFGATAGLPSSARACISNLWHLRQFRYENNLRDQSTFVYIPRQAESNGNTLFSRHFPGGTE